jgi:acyl-CoA synthetase (AMP-forming)/AMP-acid ligase II
VLTVGELDRRNARTKPDCDAYVEHARRVTWSQLHARTDRLGHVLKDLGVASGERVGIVSSDSIEVAEVFVTCAKIGATRVGINGRLSSREIAYLIDDSTPRALFVQAKHEKRVREALAEAKTQPAVIGFGGGHGFSADYEALIDNPAVARPLEQTPAERLMICYTTGSTGMPKGAIYNHIPMVQSIAAIALSEGANHDDVWFHAMPASGIPIMHMMRNLFHGSKCAIVGEWTPEAALSLIERERTTITVVVPTMLTSLMESGLIGKYDMSSMRQFGYGAAPLPPSTIREAVQAFGCDLLQMYGSTELMGMSMMLYPSDHEKGLRDRPEVLSSAGRPLSFVDIRIVDDDGNDVPDGEIGELLVKSDFVIQGYWNRPEEYAKTVKDGWLYTGDMGRVDKEGYVYLGDRAKFRIKTGGYNVFPTEVENVLAEHPAVLEVSVVGLPDPKWGERIHAVVSLRSGTEATGDALREFCRGKIADFKVPKSVDIWPEIPKGVTGKILKRQIIDHYAKN